MDNNNLNNVEQTVMDRIKSGKLRVRSKYIFLAEKLGLSGAFALSFIIAILLFSLVLFYMKETDALHYLSFGKEGFLAFLEAFPYQLIIGLIVVLFLAGYLISKNDISYKKPFGFFAVVLVLFVIFFGIGLAFTDVSERIEGYAFSKRFDSFALKPFLKRGVDMRNRGVAGNIVEVKDDYIVIETPFGEQSLDLKDADTKDLKNDFEIGQFIISAGKRQGESVFKVKRIRVLKEDDVLMIKRGIERRHMSPEGKILFIPRELPMPKPHEMAF